MLVSEFEVPGAAVSVIPLPSPRGERTSPFPEHDPKEILFFGTLRRNKGIHILLQAIAALPRKTRVRFRIAGRGERDLEELVLRAAAADDRIVADVRWIPDYQMADLYSRAWAVVVPYLDQFAAQSGTVRVAYTYGTPVIASNVGALGAGIREDGTGWLVSPGNVEELSSCIAEALGDERSRETFSTKSSVLGRQRSAATIASAFRSLYERLCGC
jgi:glycosyltransferase involved in cell wall biosynthesis